MTRWLNRRVPHAAGTGSAVLGTVQALLAALVAPLMGLGGRDVGVPLFLGMTLCVGVACLALRLTRGSRPPNRHPNGGSRLLSGV